MAYLTLQDFQFPNWQAGGTTGYSASFFNAVRVACATIADWGLHSIYQIPSTSDTSVNRVTVDTKSFSPPRQRHCDAINSDKDFFLSKRSGQRVSHRPPRENAITQNARIQSNLIRPLGQCLRFAIKIQQMANLSVIHLGFTRSPIAIFRAIVAIIIPTFKGMLRRRPRRHISNKIGSIHPSWANFNPSTAIPRKGFSVRITATLFHSLPHAIQRVARHPVASRLAPRFFIQASTRFSIARGKGGGADDSGLSAFATTEPVCVFVKNAHIFNNQQSPILQANAICNVSGGRR